MKAIIEDTKEARDKFGHAHGSHDLVLTDEEREAIENGKVVAMYGGEYVTFVRKPRDA